MKLKTHKLDIQPRAKLAGIENANQLQAAIGGSLESAYGLWNGSSKMIRLSTIDILCELFKCRIEQLFEVEEMEVEGE